MKDIVFIDAEVDLKSKKILDIGSLTNGDLKLHSNSVTKFLDFIDQKEYICGHNIIKHDLLYLERAANKDLSRMKAIDTLYLSPLLFPAKPYHALLKDDKLQTEELNNPLNDAIKAKDLFFDELTAFQEINNEIKQIFCALLSDKREFKWFFDFADCSVSDIDLISFIQKEFLGKIDRKSVV